MIKVTRLDNRELVVNAGLIEFVEATPETIISMTTGRKIVVKESVEDVQRLALEYVRQAGPVIRAATNGAAREGRG